MTADLEKLVKQVYASHDMQADYARRIAAALDPDAVARMVQEAKDEARQELLHDQDCACAYDNLTDVCLGHLAATRALVQKAVQAEREACAWTATSFLVGDPAEGIPLRGPMASEVAAAIRARGEA